MALSATLLAKVATRVTVPSAGKTAPPAKLTAEALSVLTHQISALTSCKALFKAVLLPLLPLLRLLLLVEALESWTSSRTLAASLSILPMAYVRSPLTKNSCNFEKF